MSQITCNLIQPSDHCITILQPLIKPHRIYGNGFYVTINEKEPTHYHFLNMLLCTLLLVPYFVSLVDGQTKCGDRPTQLINVELECENAPEVKGSLLDRIETRAKGFFERAKQELGIKSDAKVEPKKCEYYKCVFDRLGMLNQLDLPDLSLVQSWISKNVANKDELNNQVATCFRLLATSAVNIQNNCETTTHLMMCLHSVDKCETFKYP